MLVWEGIDSRVGVDVGSSVTVAVGPAIGSMVDSDVQARASMTIKTMGKSRRNTGTPLQVRWTFATKPHRMPQGGIWPIYLRWHRCKTS